MPDRLSAALTHAVRTLAPEKQYETVYVRMSASPRPERYYPTLAQTGTQQAIDCLVENFAGSRRAEAFDALLRVEARRSPACSIRSPRAIPIWPTAR